MSTNKYEPDENLEMLRIAVVEALAVLDGWCQAATGGDARYCTIASGDGLYRTEVTATSGTGWLVAEEGFTATTRLASLQAAAQWVREQGGGT